MTDEPLPPMPELAGVRHEHAQVDGLRLHYTEAGSGPPLILLHGWPQHWWAWRHLIGPLAEHHRVICPDARGMGWSQGRPGGYTWQRMARDVVELMDALGIQRARLIGHDWGLVTGYRACFNWPERFEHFTALGGIHLWSLQGGPLRLYLAPWHIYLISLLGRTATTRLGVTERCLHAWRHAGQFTPEETEVYMRAMRRSEAVRATIQFDRNVVLHELPHHARHYRLIRQRVPTLHLNGDHDPLTIGVPESYRDYADDMQLELVPDCGHFIAEERPDWLLDRLSRLTGV
jgi:pimeloyl-ACP methyl ester carboxylesterase